MQCWVSPDVFRRGLTPTNASSVVWNDDSSTLRLSRPKKKLPPEFFQLCYTAPLLFTGLRSRDFRLTVATQVKPSDEERGDGDKKVQDLLVDLLRLESGKARVSEFVEDRSKYLTEIAEQANEEFDRIAKEAKKSMDEAGAKVLEHVNAEADEFEEELAAARAEMEANDRDLDEFEKSVEKARSEGLFFKTLFTKSSMSLSARSPEAQKEIMEEARAVTEALDEGTKKAAGSKLRRTFYGVMIFLLVLTLVEAISSGNVEWTKLIVYVILLVALAVQLTFENTISSKGDGNEKK